MPRHLTRPLVAAAALCGLAVHAAAPVFYDDDPILTEPITQDATAVTRYEPDLVYQTLEGLFHRVAPTDTRAANVNTIDEVPDGPWYVNREAAGPLTPERVARAANMDAGPAPGPWVVVSAKSDGVTPGFTIRDSANGLWFVKFDPPGWRAMATGTEITAAKLFWAVGYHTVEYHIGRLVPSNLTIGPNAKIAPNGEAERAMVPEDVGRLLARADRDADGSYRVILSKAAPGRPVGRIRFWGTRSDDPNDVVPHEDRRELRGYRIFAAWLNHVDAKGINSLEALVTENGRSFVRHYLLDFGSALGSAATGPREGWEGYETLVEDFGEIGRRVLAFGARVPAWRLMSWFESPAVGRLPRSHTSWNPDAWAPHVTNPAFENLRDDDAFWAAVKLSAISDALIEAAVGEGQFGDREAEGELARVIRERRDRILQTYLPRLNPVVDPKIDATGLRFANAAVAARVAAAPQGYQARWSRFDNATGATTPLGETAGADSPLPVPPFGDAAFIQVDVRAVGAPVAAWSSPLTLHFKRTTDGWRLVGLVRLP